MASQIIFFEKNKGDISEDAVTATASEAPTIATFALNRSNRTAWITTGSVDSNNTTWEVDFGDSRDVSEVLLIKHNFKAFTVKYWDGAAYQAFTPAISETTNTAESNRYSVTQVSTQKIQIQITGTMVTDADKYLYQFVATNLIGQLAAWPQIKKPTFSRNKKKTKMLSGKLNVAENIGSFSCDLDVKEWRSDADLDIVEALYDSNEGFLVWLCGGDASQFFSERQGYRFEDIFLMKCVDDYQPQFVEGMYQRGMGITLSLAEVVG